MSFKAIFVNCLVILPAVFLTSIPAYARAELRKSILILHSYHAGLDWTDDVTRGMYSILSNTPYVNDIYVEYLDTKRVNGPDYLRLFGEALRAKYAGVRLDLVLTSDDDAYRFVLDYRDTLFRDTPLVFCGVNYLPAETLTNHPWFTGIQEHLDIEKTIELALQLFPGTTNLVILNDMTTTGQANQKLLNTVLPRFAGRFTYTILSNATAGEAQAYFHSLNSGSVGLLLTFNRDKDGRIFTYPEEAQLIRSVSGIPLFGVWSMLVGNGILGGLVTRGYDQGHHAARLAMKILSGANPSGISILDNEVNRYMFDYNELTRFNITPVKLPEDSILLNKPASTASVPVNMVWLSMIALLLLTVSIIILIVNIFLRRQAEEKLRDSEERYRSFINTTSEGFLMISLQGQIIDVNESICRMLEVSPEDMIGRRMADFTAPESQETLSRQQMKIPFTVQRSYELIFISRSGHKLFVRISATTVRDQFGNPLYAFAFISDMSRIEQMIRNLEESERRFRSLAETNETIILIYSRRKIVYANTATSRLTGYPMQGILGRAFFELLGEEDREALTAMLDTNTEGDSCQQDLEITIRTQAEAMRCLVCRISDVMHYEGHPARILSCFDITERKRMEEELRNSESMYRSLAEASHDFIYVIDRNLVLKYVNLFAANQLGLDRDSITGHSMTELFPPQIAARQQSDLEEVLTKGEPLYTETESFLHGQPIWLGTWLIPVRQNDGSIGSILGISRNISEGRKAIEKIAEEQRRLSSIFSSISDGIIACGLDSRIILINQSAAAMTGTGMDEALGKSLYEVFSARYEKTQASCNRIIEDVILKGAPLELHEHLILTPRQGPERTVIASATPLEDRDNRMPGVVVVFKDIGEKVKMEKKYETIARVESLGVLAGGIAHDFNNILTGIMGNVSLARVYTGENEKAVSVLEEAEKACWRARDLTRQLMTFSRGGQPLRKAEKIDELLKNALSFLLRGSETISELVLEENLYPVEIDSGQISQVIQNLVLNAREAMEDKGKIKVTARNIHKEEALRLPCWKGQKLLHKKYVEITFADEGMGIPKEIRDRIFEPYFTTKPNGSGLGLAVAFSIIRNHEGAITLESEMGRGTEFHILLPATEKKPSGSRKDKNSLKHGKASILVMDDENIILTLLEKMLSALGYGFTAARDGGEALRLYQSAYKNGHPYDLVLLDLTVPSGMGGKETMLRLKDQFPDVKAAVMSGYTRDQALSSPGEYGFAGVLRKPFEISDLSALLAELLKEPDNTCED